MSAGVVRVLLGAALCSVWLAGCETWNKAVDQFRPPPNGDAPAETTGSIPPPPDPAVVLAPPENTFPIPPPTVTPDGHDAYDDLQLGKRHFRESNFGLAERYFRRAVEKGPKEAGRDAEAWLGLAASYDRLRRFELADRAYNQALKILGPTPEVLNNVGYSYLLRGDYLRARAKLYAARDLDPTNPYILSNIKLLEESVRGR